MRTPPPVAVNHNVLTWARLQSGYSVERVARRLHVSEDRVRAWEQGVRTPTVRQLQLLASFLHRPLGVFFMAQPPDVPPLATEYRRLRGVRPGDESPELRLALRQMLIRRERALSLMEELGESVPDFTLRAHLRDSPTDVAGRLRAALDVDIGTQRGWASQWAAWRGWRAAVERIGVLVFQFPKVPLEEVRGLALLSRPLPVAAINGKETPRKKTVTLVRKVVHLMLAGANEEHAALVESRSVDTWGEVEEFAESVAGRVLLPENFHCAEAHAVHRHSPSWRPPRRPEFATPVAKTLGRGGRPFAQLVLEAMDANRITTVDASRYLDLRFGHFDHLRAHLGDQSPHF